MKREKWHINKKGVPAICNAEPGNCPFGGNGEHYPTREIAQRKADKENRLKNRLLPETENDRLKLKTKGLLKEALTKNDLVYIEKRIESINNLYRKEPYSKKCRSVERLEGYKPNKKLSEHMLAERMKKDEKLKRAFGTGEMLGYYLVDHRVKDTRGKEKYKKQVFGVHSSGYVQCYDYENDGRLVTVFLPHVYRTETILLLANELPKQSMLRKINKNYNRKFKELR